jgi:hypothetical protein
MRPDASLPADTLERALSKLDLAPPFLKNFGDVTLPAQIRQAWAPSGLRVDRRSSPQPR